MIELVSITYYTKVLYWTLFVLCMLTGLYYFDSKGCNKLLRQNSILLPLALSIVLVFYYGLRPISWTFSDMVLYNHRWNITEVSSYELFFDFEAEWFFELVMRTCKVMVHDSQFWFLVIALFYVGCQLWACKKLLWENVWMAVMFVFFSYQFYGFATNGLRNGMGTAIMMLSISYFADRNRMGYIFGFVLFLLAIGCHRTVIVPMAALFVSLFIIKDIKYAIIIWIGCIAVSLVAGTTVQNFIVNMGFDTRMSTYSSVGEDIMSEFSRTGYRWDFLLYSAVPVLLAWYVRSKGIFDRTFTLLANTYIIANSFWVLVNRVAFSNRFAYLSWFMYGLVLAYAVIRVPIWKDQDKKAGLILMAHSAFTIFMFLIGK